MKKTIFTTLMTLGLSLNAHANTINLDKKTHDYGALAQERNTAANEVLTLTRTSKTPKVVTIKYQVNSVQKSCVETEIVATEIPAVTKIACEANLDKSHTCASVQFEAYNSLARKCVREGLELISNQKELVITFNNAIKLEKEATETIQIALEQKAINSDKINVKASIDSAAVYKIRHSLGRLRFRAKRK